MASGLIKQSFSNGTLPPDEYSSWYRQYSDGVMWCIVWGSGGGARGVAYDKEITYPKAFSVVPFVFGACNNDSAGNYNTVTISFYNMTKTGCNVRLSRPSSSYVGGSFRVLAIGRWK